MPPIDQAAAGQAVEQAYREHRARVLATLVGGLRDFELAEDVLQEAFTLALERWPRDGTPNTPAAWLYTVARNRAIDRLRQRRTAEAKLEQIGAPVESSSASRSTRCLTPSLSSGTSDWRCCSRAATPPWRPRRGWR